MTETLIADITSLIHDTADGTVVTLTVLVAGDVPLGSVTVDICDFANAPTFYAQTLAWEHLGLHAEIVSAHSKGWEVAW